MIILDGDELRDIFNATNNIHVNYSRKKRLILSMQYAKLCQHLSRQGMTVVIATISMFKEIYLWNRVNLPRYFEVYIKVPLYELRKRDPKGIYKNFDTGKLINVAGLDIDIDEHKSFDYIIKFKSEQNLNLEANKLIKQFLGSYNEN